MIYTHVLTIPANTSEHAPVTYELRLARGVITHVEIEFPPGCAGLACCRILYRERALYPTNPEGYFRADGYTVSWDDDYQFPARPAHIKLIGWNDDDTYEHTLTFRFVVIPVSAIPSWFRRLLREA